jgi:hypothetical protein
MTWPPALGFSAYEIGPFRGPGTLKVGGMTRRNLPN